MYQMRQQSSSPSQLGTDLEYSVNRNSHMNHLGSIVSRTVEQFLNTEEKARLENQNYTQSPENDTDKLSELEVENSKDEASKQHSSIYQSFEVQMNQKNLV